MIRGIAATLAARLAGWLIASEDEADEPLPGRPDLLCDGYLIQRQVEQITIELDRALPESRLSIHLTLPAEARTESTGTGDEPTFLVPLLFVPKAEPRLGLTVLSETGASVPVLDREECDRLTATIVAVEVERTLQSPDTPLQIDRLEGVLRFVIAAPPLQASMAVSEILENVEKRTSPNRTSVGAWEESGIPKLLVRLVEHSIVWVELKGAVGERRVIAVSRRVPLTKHSALRWRFGKLRRPKFSRLRRIRPRRAARGGDADQLHLGESVYGRRSYRVSLSTLWERLWGWLALRPTDFVMPTIPASRGDVYELELKCPSGHTPRDLRVFSTQPLAEPGDVAPQVQTILTADTAQLRLARRSQSDDLSLRFTIGLAPHAVLALWWLACAFAASLLWAFASIQPQLADDNKSIAGPLFVAGFSFLATQAAKAWTADPALPGVALILLLTAADVAAGALLLIGAQPFGLEANWTWSICAVVATLAAAALLAAWLLTRDAVWSVLAEVGGGKRRLSEVALIGCGVATVAFLLGTDPAPTARGAAAVVLLVLAVLAIVLASQGGSRLNRAGSPLLAGMVCLLLGCIALRGALVYVDPLQTTAEQGALLLLGLATFLGSLLALLARQFRPAFDEVVVSPDIGRAIVAGERLHELQVLRSREVRELG